MFIILFIDRLVLRQIKDKFKTKFVSEDTKITQPHHSLEGLFPSMLMYFSLKLNIGD